jgi:uncharacterized membrane protein
MMETKSAGAQFSSSRLGQNIDALLRRKREEEASAPLEDRVAVAITRFVGSMLFVYIHAALFVCWISINIGLLPLIPAFDPSLVILAMVASVEAIFLSTFVLISQNRMAAAADKRADLNLQISLLAEHETTRILSMLHDVGKKLSIDFDHEDELSELTQSVFPEDVLTALEEADQDDHPARRSP